MPGCQRCHVRLNTPVQGLEDNIERYMNSHVTPIRFAVQGPTLPWRSATGISSTKEEYHGKSEISYGEVVPDQRRTKNPR